MIANTTKITLAPVVATTSPPIIGSTCTPECENGGTCTSPGVCTCVAGWRGVRCQEGIAQSWIQNLVMRIESIIRLALCTPACMNGGTCTEPGTCSCTAHWQGPTCQQGIWIHPHHPPPHQI